MVGIFMYANEGKKKKVLWDGRRVQSVFVVGDVFVRPSA
jgi:hypothetical protein